MNIFCPQSIQTAIELEKMADVQRQIISPASSVPIIGVIQDSLLGAYNMTQPSMRIDWKDAMNILSYTTIDDFKDFKKKEYKGTELFSMIIPKKISTDRKTFKLTRGELDPEKGVLSKPMLGSSKSNSMIHLIWDEYGVDETRHFLDNIQRMINNFNLMNGFTCGIGDVDISKDLLKKLETLSETKKLEVNHLITELENNPDLMDENLFELSVFSELNAVSEEVSKLIIDNMDPNNNFYIMAIGSGSKGSPSNIGQMGGCIGQQAIEGKRAKKKLNGRALPYFFQNDDSASARGFVDSSFIEGMKPTEFIFHNMGSREGLIDTAIRTAESGYIQRKLIKTMEDISVKYDGTVRNSNDTILQFTYGDSGIDTTKQYKHTLDSVLMSNDEFDKVFSFTKDELRKVSITENENNKYVNQLKEMRDQIRISQNKVTLNYKVFNADYMLPTNFMRIIENTMYENLDAKDKLDAKYVVSRLEDVIEYKNTMLACVSKKEQKNKDNIKLRDERVSKTVFRYALHNFLAPKRVIFEYKFNKTQFDSVIEQVINGFNRSVVQPGQMVGILAAQSIGEPVTQLTLNTFHSAGIGSKGTASLGVGRVRELLSFSRNMKTPMMEIYLTDKYKKSKDMANKIASHIKYTNIADIRKRLDVYYDPTPYKKDGFMEQDNVYNIFHSHNPGKYSCQSEINNLPWLLRIELDKEKLMEKEISLLDIKSKFCSFWEKRYQSIRSLKKDEKKLIDKVQQLAVLSNSDNDKTPVIHIRFDMTNFDFGTIVKFTEIVIDSFKLKGMEGIEDILDVKKERSIVIDSKTGALNKEEEYVIYTKGVNLVDIRYINGIDLQRTTCNDVVALYEEFGIEAARMALLKEIKLIIKNTNYQHLSILLDVMTSNGNLVSVDRHGLNKVDTNPFARASFEKTIDQFINAAVFSEIDSMRSVSSRIMAGLVIKGGTGAVNLKLDTDMLEKSEFIEESVTYDRIGAAEITSDPVIKDIVDGDNREDIFMPV